jgi:hypothetical protein
MHGFEKIVLHVLFKLDLFLILCKEVDLFLFTIGWEQKIQIGIIPVLQGINQLFVKHAFG